MIVAAIIMLNKFEFWITKEAKHGPCSLLFRSAPFFSFKLCSSLLFCGLFYSVLLWSALFYSVLFYFVLVHFVVLWSALFYSVVLWSALFYSVLLCCVVLCCVLPCSVLLCSVLFCTILFCSDVNCVYSGLIWSILICLALLHSDCSDLFCFTLFFSSLVHDVPISSILFWFVLQYSIIRAPTSTSATMVVSGWNVDRHLNTLVGPAIEQDYASTWQGPSTLRVFSFVEGLRLCPVASLHLAGS